MSQQDGSFEDTRTQEARIAAGDAPAGSIAFESEVSGRIDVPAGTDIAALERALTAYARRKGLSYHPSDRDDVLRAIGRDVPLSLAEALANAFTKYDERAAS